MQQLLGAVRGNQEAMDGFVRAIAGVVSPASAPRSSARRR
jgi:hypothetical protein